MIRCKELIIPFVIGMLLLICFALPTAGFASGNIYLTVTDPDRVDNSGATDAGTTVNTILSVPVVTFGENKELGTMRITGKDTMGPSLKPGDKIMVTLPQGICYMQIPTDANYRNYVDWPEYVDGKSNQLQDDGSLNPGIRFVDGTARTITVEVGHVTPGNNILTLDFVFNKDDYSKVRVSRLLDLSEEYREITDEKITRLEFMKNLADITVPFPSCPFNYVRDKTKMKERFNDISNVSSVDAAKIKPLADAGLITGERGLLRPDDYITEEEAAQMLDTLRHTPAAGADAEVDAASPNAAGLSGVRFITKGEALKMLQNTFESWAYPNSIDAAPYE